MAGLWLSFKVLSQSPYARASWTPLPQPGRLSVVCYSKSFSTHCGLSKLLSNMNEACQIASRVNHPSHHRYSTHSYLCMSTYTRLLNDLHSIDKIRLVVQGDICHHGADCLALVPRSVRSPPFGLPPPPPALLDRGGLWQVSMFNIVIHVAYMAGACRECPSGYHGVPTLQKILLETFSVLYMFHAWHFIY